jgi:hypothetical protein|tara:strand:+ start:48 stop:536 length:489 start_codon:yes stop_codon:yes gene_type:complete
MSDELFKGKFCKFYLVKFSHKRTGKELYKFGTTSYKDVLERFSARAFVKYNKYNSLANQKDLNQYSDFNINVLASTVYKTRQEAVEIEQKYLVDRFPKGAFIMEEHLGEPEGKYSNMSGVTEVRPLTNTQVKTVLSEMYNTNAVSGQQKKKTLVREARYYNR